jgi:hypothetical protein
VKKDGSKNAMLSWLQRRVCCCFFFFFGITIYVVRFVRMYVFFVCCDLVVAFSFFPLFFFLRSCLQLCVRVRIIR